MYKIIKNTKKGQEKQIFKSNLTFFEAKRILSENKSNDNYYLTVEYLEGVKK